VGLSLEGAQPVWVVGPSDPEVTRRYVSDNSETPSDAAGLHVQSFPRLLDAFRISEARGGLDVCETHACWFLGLPDSPTPGAAEQPMRVGDGRPAIGGEPAALRISPRTPETRPGEFDWVLLRFPICR
jgi:hypothetical protein